MHHLHKFNPNSSSIDHWPQQDLYGVPGIPEVMLTNRELATFFQPWTATGNEHFAGQDTWSLSDFQTNRVY